MDRATHSYWNAHDVARLLALVENERRYYAEMMAELPVATAIVSSDLSFLITNRAFRTLFHLKWNEMQSLRLTDVHSGLEIAAHALAAFATNQAMNSVVVGEFRVSIAPFRGAEDPGQELLLVVHPEDVSASQKLDDAGYDAIFWRRGVNLNFESVSPQIADILGYSPERLIANPDFWIGIVHPDDRAIIENFYGGITADARYYLEYRAFDAKGNLVRLRDTVRLHMGRMTGITLDVTNRGLIENDHVQSEKFESLNRLARRVTHEFNNLHMVIKGYGEEVLHALPKGGPAQSDMEEILGTAARVASAVEKLDVYIRRPAANSSLFDIIAFLEKFSRGIRLPDDVNFTLTLHSSDAPVHGDAGNLEKILNWLFTMDAGGNVRVQTSVFRAAEVHTDKAAALKPGEYSVLTISNSGPPFDAIATEPILLRAHTVMRMMGGGFDAFSDSRGNTFRLILPSAAEGLHPGLPESVPSRTVLVVEDEPGIRALIAKILLRHGYQVLEAASGTEGLRIAMEFGGKVDLLITDLLMPQMNGRELVDKLLLARPDTKVLFISGFTGDPLLNRTGLPADVVFLQKPFTLESLVEKVAHALESRA